MVGVLGSRLEGSLLLLVSPTHDSGVIALKVGVRVTYTDRVVGNVKLAFGGAESEVVELVLVQLRVGRTY